LIFVLILTLGAPLQDGEKITAGYKIQAEASSEDVLADNKPLIRFFRKTIKARPFQR
jgi:hypothetical protein